MSVYIEVLMTGMKIQGHLYHGKKVNFLVLKVRMVICSSGWSAAAVAAHCRGQWLANVQVGACI